MDKDLKDLFQTNDDIIFILSSGAKIGWDGIKPQSINRIVYLSKVLYSFVNESKKMIMDYYHFSVDNMSGPMSSIINKSLKYLDSNEFVTYLNSVVKLNVSEEKLEKILDSKFNQEKGDKQDWFKTIILLLGKYGENRVFSFTINDPLYIEKVASNSIKEISFEKSENKTLKVLNSFKEAFEDSIEDTSSITKQEYLELYFDYVFSQTIK